MAAGFRNLSNALQRPNLRNEEFLKTGLKMYIMYTKTCQHPLEPSKLLAVSSRRC